MIRSGKIKIFDNGIEVDKKLPKYQIKEEKKSGLNFDGSVPSENWTVSGSDGNSFRDNDSQLDYLEYLNKNAPNLMNRFKIWLYKKIYSKTFDHKEDKKVKSIDVIKFFDEVKLNVNELDKKKIDNILDKYKLTLKNAKDNNQIALIERLNDYAGILKYEVILSASNFNKYLKEEDIVAFHKVASVSEKYKTNLCLTYIKNFVKVIPDDVTELKRKADELEVFDNYVILHYDPFGKSVDDTKKEKEKKKDPILFGLIKNSRNLYYIDDWIDDYCDLTLDVLIETIGKEEANIIDEESIVFQESYEEEKDD